MGSEWPIVRLANHCLKIGSGATPKGGSGVYLDKGEIYLIRSQNVYNDGFSPDGLVFITDDAADKLKNVVVEKNDILLNITGDSVARVCLAVAEYLPARVNQHVAIIRPNPKDFDSRFLRYFLASPYQQSLLLNLASAGATRNALTKGMIEDFEVPKPPIEIQIAIADQLEGYDNKIHLNRQLNQTLEQMAQALFKSWFVDFDPVIDNALAAGNAIPEELQDRAERRQQQLAKADHKPLPDNIRKLFPSEFELTESLGWVPRGWGVKSLFDIVEITSSKRIFADDYCESGVPFFRGKEITEMSQGKSINTEIFISEDKFSEIQNKYGVPKKDDILITSVGTIGNVYLVGEADRFYFKDGNLTWINKYKKMHIPHFILAWLKSPAGEMSIENIKIGTTQQAITIKALSQLELIVGDLAVHELFENMMQGFYQKTSKNLKHIESLSNLRDTLLPKLISGELRIPEAQGLVEAVLG